MTKTDRDAPNFLCALLSDADEQARHDAAFGTGTVANWRGRYTVAQVESMAAQSAALLARAA